MNELNFSKSSKHEFFSLSLAKSKPLGWIVFALALSLGTGCATENLASKDVELSGEGGSPGTKTQARILSAYHGLDALPPGARVLCGMPVLLENGDRVHPISLGDDDPDNHVIACIAETSPAVSVRVAAGLFHDPGDDANPATSTDVISGL